MSQSIDKALITQFSDQVHVAAQQMKSRLMPHVRIKKMTGDLFAYDGLEAVEAFEANDRSPDVQNSDITHNRRKIRRRRFYVNLFIDEMDDLAVLIDPERHYAEAAARALFRKFDKVGIDALFSDVQTGRDFETTLTFPNDNGVVVNATAGLTYEKLLEISENFTDNEVGLDLDERILLGLTGQEHTALMKETELTSGDFTRQFAVERGVMVNAAGLDIIRFGASVNNPQLAVNSNIRDCFAISTRGLCYGMSKELNIKIQERPDKVGTKQVQVTGILGAVRTEGKLVQKVQTTAS